MFEDYKTAVLNFYREKREKHLLSTDFENPNREKLRKECTAVFLRKNSQKDKDFVQSFFDPQRKYTDQIRSIERFKLDKFRPLIGFLTTDKGIRDDNHVKLLAWLLDFPSYEEWRDAKNLVVIPPSPGGGGDVGEGTGGNMGGSRNDPKIQNTLKPIQKKLISCIIFLIICIGIYQFRQSRTDLFNSFSILFSSGNEKCMYWTGESYQAVACNKGPKDAKTIPLDVGKMRKFRRVMQPDTLTKDALGKVWYTKRAGMIEFYTDSGAHPTDSNKRLLPVTVYILNKYISYHRYLLNLIFWSVSIILFSLIFGIGTIYFGRKVKKQRIKTEKQKVKAAA